MNHRFARPFIKINQRGFTLTEIIVAVGLTSLITLGAFGLITVANNQKIASEAEKDLTSSLLYFKQVLNRQNSAIVQCQAIMQLSPNGSAFNAAGNSPVQINLPEGVYASGIPFPRSNNLTINNLFLGNPVLISQNSTDKSYVATLYIDPAKKISGQTYNLKQRAIATVGLQVNNAGTIIGCNMGISIADSQTNTAKESLAPSGMRILRHARRTFHEQAINLQIVQEA